MLSGCVHKRAAATHPLAHKLHHALVLRCREHRARASRLTRTSEHLEDFAEMAKIELSVIDKGTQLRSYKNELRQLDLYYHLAQGIQG
jgi:L-arabinose isomerase